MEQRTSEAEIVPHPSIIATISSFDCNESILVRPIEEERAAI